MDKGDIVSVLTVAGEFVGRLVEAEGTVAKLEKPRMLVQSEQGMGFAKGICMTGEMDPTEAEFQSVVFVVPTNKDIANAWVQATTGIALA